ncbi:MAG TPA: hypothetical protein V6D17_19180 [Candidatus Obscuribacterales bacterium]
MTADDEKFIRVGELLVSTGVVSSSDITEAIQVSRRLAIPLGRVLITSGCVPEPLMHAALEVQPLVKEGQITSKAAVKALKRVWQEGTTLKEELERLNLKPKYGKGSNDLADLLIESNLVNQEQIDEALKSSFESGTPLGSALVLQGALSPSFLSSIMSIQDKIAQGEVTHQEGVEELKRAFLLWLKVGESLNGLRQPEEKEQVAARTSSAKEAAKGGNQKRESQQPQRQPVKEEFKPPQPEMKEAAPPAPKTAPGRTEESPAAKWPKITTRPEGRRLVDLLDASGIIDGKDLPSAFSVLLDDPVRSAQFLFEAGLIDDNTRRNALRSYNLIRRGRIREEQAVDALRQSTREGVPIRAVFARQGIADHVDEHMQRRISRGMIAGVLAALIGGLLALLRKR